VPQDPEDTVSVTPIRAAEPAKRAPISRGTEGCLVEIYGQELGRRIQLTGGTFEIGRSSKCDLMIDQDSVSRHHARIARSREGRYSVADLGSTNGTYVNDVHVSEQNLTDGDQVKIGRTIFKFMFGSNIEASYHEEIYRLMTVDGLTQLFNRRYFNETLEREVNRCRRYSRPLSLFIFDIDHFKKTNDSYGHVAGDALLRQLAQVVKPRMRREDILARVGGEEFAAILPEVGRDGALATAEKVRETVAMTHFPFEELTITTSVSIGVTELDLTNDDPKALYARADAALYRAKSGGRNRVCQ
jgi:two-component system, cell cycle response regulator